MADADRPGRMFPNPDPDHLPAIWNDAVENEQAFRGIGRMLHDAQGYAPVKRERCWLTAALRGSSGKQAQPAGRAADQPDRSVASLRRVRCREHASAITGAFSHQLARLRSGASQQGEAGSQPGGYGGSVGSLGFGTGIACATYRKPQDQEAEDAGEPSRSGSW